MFEHINHNIAALEEKIQSLDSASNNIPLDESEPGERKVAQQDLWTWLKRKDMFWAQNSRGKWLKEGDKNTRYFYTLASIRERKNSITSLPINGSDITDPPGLKKEAIKYFKNIFTEEHPTQPTFNGLDFRRISAQQSATLMASFSKEEVDNAVASCNSQKALRPDGFNFSFIKSAWEIIKEDIYNMVDNFWSTNSLPKGSNAAWVALIPKVDTPCGFKDFRPISMVSCICKIIANYWHIDSKK